MELARPIRGQAITQTALLLAVVLAVSFVSEPAHAKPTLVAMAQEVVRAPEDQVAVALSGPALVRVESRWAVAVVDDRGRRLNGGRPYEVAETCSGFLVRPDGWVVTASGCLDPRPRARRAAIDEWIAQGVEGSTAADRPALEIRARGWRVEGASARSPPDDSVVVTIGDGVRDHRAQSADIVEIGRGEGTAALLRVGGRELLAVAIADEVPAQPETVVAAGFPPEIAVTQAADATFVDVTLSPPAGGQGATLDAALPAGMRGGPVVAFDGTVVAVADAAATDDAGDRTGVVAGSAVRDLLDRHDVEPALGGAGRLYYEAVQLLYRDSEPERARARLAEARAINPHFPTAARLESFADEVAAASPRRKPTDRPDSGTPLIGAAAALVALLAVAGWRSAHGRRGARRVPLRPAAGDEH